MAHQQPSTGAALANPETTTAEFRQRHAGPTGIIEAQGECMKGFAAFLESCDNLPDLENLALFFRVYQRYKSEGGWVGEACQSALLMVGARLAARDGVPIAELDGLNELDNPESTSVSKVAMHFKFFLERASEAHLEFVAELLNAIDNGLYNKPAPILPREAVAQYLQSFDTPKAAQREPRRTKGGHRKAA